MPCPGSFTLLSIYYWSSFPSESKMAGVVQKGFTEKVLVSPGVGSGPNARPQDFGLSGPWYWVEPQSRLWLPEELPRSSPPSDTFTSFSGATVGDSPSTQMRLLLTQRKLPTEAHSSWAFTSCQTQAWPALQVTLNQLQTTFLPLGGVPGEMPGYNVASRVTSSLSPPSAAPEPSWPGRDTGIHRLAELGCQGETGRDQY